MEVRHFKWDAQVGDHTSLARAPLMMHSSEWAALAADAVKLYDETLALEVELLQRPSLHAALSLPRPLRALFARGRPVPATTRVMRFDFHPTPDGWRVSEVNSDVPGGYTEASHFSALMAEHVPGASTCGDPTRAVVESILRALGGRGTVALVSAPGHMEDHQVVAQMADALRGAGLDARALSLGQLAWTHGRARAGFTAIDLIFRFYQAEWLALLPRDVPWSSLFVNADTPVVNAGIAALSESKRLPLLFSALQTSTPTWRRLLPETRSLADAPWTTSDDWLIKSAYSNNGDTVSIRSEMTATEWARRSALARLSPGTFIAQRRFSVAPVHDEQGPLHPCVGVYVVDGVVAGAYARASRGAVIDSTASDFALLLYDAS